MESIGDYIYIIILVIAGLSGLLKMRKKKPAETNTHLPEQSEFEEFEEYFKYEEKEIKPEIPKWEKSKILKKEPLSYDNLNDFSSLRIKKEIKPEIKPQTYANISKSFNFSMVNEDDENDFDFELNIADDFRKAVIYSEILNKKY